MINPGTVLQDRYLIEKLIGEGGMGAVYMAEQDQPLRRRVALKIIKLGMDTREVIARFEQERQALAMMDHPNSAKVRFHLWPPRHRRSGALQGPDTRPS